VAQNHRRAAKKRLVASNQGYARQGVDIILKHESGIAYREASPDAPTGGPVLLIHGFPQSSYMWLPVVEAIGKSGRRAIAPDLVGYGDSPADPPGTWERHVEAIERFRESLGLERVVLGLHDWGGLIGLRWACDHPDAVSALILSNTGFFADSEWHDLARALRTPGLGERLLDNLTQEAFATMLRDFGGRFTDEALDQYWKTFTSAAGRQGVLELYRSGDFDKLKPYDGQVGAMGVPALILWGRNDLFAPVEAAERFQNEILDSKVIVLDDSSHFLYDDEPVRCAREIVEFLDEQSL
jgi:haloalkane dehalogenase